MDKGTFFSKADFQAVDEEIAAAIHETKSAGPSVSVEPPSPEQPPAALKESNTTPVAQVSPEFAFYAFETPENSGLTSDQPYLPRADVRIVKPRPTFADSGMVVRQRGVPLIYLLIGYPTLILAQSILIGPVFAFLTTGVMTYVLAAIFRIATGISTLAVRLGAIALVGQIALATSLGAVNASPVLSGLLASLTGLMAAIEAFSYAKNREAALETLNATR